MNREQIEELRDDANSFRDWFEGGWNRNKGAIDDLIQHNRQLCESVSVLLAKLEIAEKALEKYVNVDSWYKDDYKGTPVFIWDQNEQPWEPALEALKAIREG